MRAAGLWPDSGAGGAGRRAVRGRARAWPHRERADARPGAWSAAVAVRLAAW